MNKTEKQNAAIARVLADDPVTTIIEAVTETSVLADELFEAIKGESAKGISAAAAEQREVRFEIELSFSGFRFHEVLMKAIREYALEVAIKKGYYDED